MDGGEIRDFVQDTMILDVHVTTRCNLRCKHCYLRSLKAEERRDMSIDTFSDLLIDASLNNVKTFILSGGEPLYHKNFEEIYHAYKLYYPSLAMATNGTLIPDYIDLFSERDRGIQISLDGDKEFHDWLRGEGTYDAVIQGIEELRERGITPSIAFTVCRENVHCADHIINLCKRYNIRYVNVNMYMPLSNSELTPLTLKQFFEVREKFRTAGIRISEPCYLKQCIAGVGVLSILPDGKVWDCSRSRIELDWEFARQLMSGKYEIKRKTCIEIKRNSLFDLVREKLRPVHSIPSLLYVASFKEYSIEELEELEKELKEKLCNLDAIPVFSGTLNCLFLYEIFGDAVAYINNHFFRETAEFVRKFSKEHGIKLRCGFCDNNRCDYLNFVESLDRVIIGCWSACNAHEKTGKILEAFRGVDGRKLDKMLIYWYYKRFGELPKWWQFFMCDFGCSSRDEIVEKKLRVLREVF